MIFLNLLSGNLCGLRYNPTYTSQDIGSRYTSVSDQPHQSRYRTKLVGLSAWWYSGASIWRDDWDWSFHFLHSPILTVNREIHDVVAMASRTVGGMQDWVLAYAIIVILIIIIYELLVCCEGGRSLRKHQEGERIKTSKVEQIRGLRVRVFSKQSL